MIEGNDLARRKLNADSLVKGVLLRLGDTFDKFLGRRWIPSSSLAASELIERMKLLLDSESIDVPGKGKVVPHKINLKMQWDKFSADAPSAMNVLENELTAAAIDHINDSHYYTFAPLSVVIEADYFTEGVRLLVSFEDFAEVDSEIEMNFKLPGSELADLSGGSEARDGAVQTSPTILASFVAGGLECEIKLVADKDRRIVVGRSGQNKLFIDDLSISKTHASLIIGPSGEISVADLGSTNGTFISGKRIGYGEVVPVNNDDVVKFGTVEVDLKVVFQSGEPATEPKVDELRRNAFIESGSSDSSVGENDAVSEIQPLEVTMKVETNIPENSENDNS